ncbi:uncharacterized protein LOC134284095 isoform X2 [Aedes albopictus]|uniref:Uncharacterized protein n=1 Tax=Aedes albopictus TaxID=7160 RepID=A0ABM1XM50_AEDAL
MDPGKKLSLREKIFSKLSKKSETSNNSVHILSTSKDTCIPPPSEAAEESDDLFAVESDSDGSGSSVGDHLVSLEDIDLDSEFFSQQVQPMMGAENGDDSSVVLARNSEPEVSTVERMESDSDSDGEEAVNIILTQLVDYGRSQEEARKFFENYDCKSQELCDRKQIEVADALHEAENLKMISSAKLEVSDEEWQHVENLSDDDGKDVEVIVSQQISKAGGKVIDVDAQLRRLLQSEKREKQLQLHKTHLLCLLGNGFHLNRTINSLVSSNSDELFRILEHFDVDTPDETEMDYLVTICDIFRSISNISETSRAIFKTYLNLHSQASVLLLLIAILRFLSIEARLVMHLNVISKAPIHTKEKIRPSQSQKSSIHTLKSIEPLPPDRYKNVPLTTAEILKQKPEFVNFSQIPQIDGAADDCGEQQQRHLLDQPPMDHKPSLWKLKLKQPVDMRSKLNSHARKRKPKSSETTSRFFNQPKPRKVQKRATEDSKFPLAPIESPTHWMEVFVPAQKRWVPVDIRSGRVDCLDDIVRHLPQPVAYVFGWSNDGTMQDVSGRYWWPNEMGSRRLRVGDKWLREVIRYFGRRRKMMQDLLDEQEIRQLRFRAPVPDKVSDFKNHPSYCLKRDLLKFQAIYPPDAPPLGYFRDEPIYARECVHTLHSREVWLRHAKVIRLHESPYKVVMSKLKREKTELELFGYWQTEDYVPPEAVGGRVPRNAYGNIEIFKDCMLPRGTVHLKLKLVFPKFKTNN